MFSRLASFFSYLYHEVINPIKVGTRKIEGTTREAIFFATRFQLLTARVQRAYANALKWFDHYVEAAAMFVLTNKGLFLFADVLLVFMLRHTRVASWAVWANVLIFQNLSFTLVSRARNSGSLFKHMKAAVASNAVWFASQAIILGILFDYISGKHGIKVAILTGIFYTVFTITGSVLAHAHALLTESGKDAVGASKKLAQFTAEEGAKLRALLTRAEAVLDKNTVTVKVDAQELLRELEHKFRVGSPVTNAQAVAPITAPQGTQSPVGGTSKN